MPSPPYAKLLVRLDGGAPLSGGITSATVGQEVQLSNENVTGVTSYLWQIYDFPADFSLPTGWLESGDRTYYSTAAVPDPFTLSHWGDYALALYINKGQDGGPEKYSDVYNTAIRIASPSGLVDISALEKQQFYLRGWPVGQKQNLRVLEDVVAGAVPDGSITTAKLAWSVEAYGASPGASAAVNAVAIQAAIDAASSAGGGDVLFPVGTYSFTALTLPAGVTLRGVGGALSTTETTGTIITVTGQRAAIRDLRVVHATQATAGNAIIVQSGATDFEITNSRIENAWNGLVGSLAPVRTYISGCTFVDCGDDAIEFLGGSGHIIDGCRFIDNNRDIKIDESVTGFRIGTKASSGATNADQLPLHYDAVPSSSSASSVNASSNVDIDIPLLENRDYEIIVRVLTTERTSGVRHKWHGLIYARRAAGGGAALETTDVLRNYHSAGTDYTVTPSAAGNNIRINLANASGNIADYSLRAGVAYETIPAEP